MPRIQQLLLDDLKRKISEVNTLRGRAMYDDLSDQPAQVIFHALSGLRAAVSRIAGVNSTYVRHVEEILKFDDFVGFRLGMLQGVAQGLLEDANNGMLTSLEELIHADIFASFLEMADQLVSIGYMDEAAVIAGCSVV